MVFEAQRLKLSSSLNIRFSKIFLMVVRKLIILEKEDRNCGLFIFSCAAQKCIQFNGMP